MAIRKYKPTTPGRRGASGADFSEVTRDEPEKSLVRPLHLTGRPERARPDHHAAPGRRAQARLPADRLPAERQGRRPGQGRAHRVRPQPHRPDRAAALRRRREALHPRPAGPGPGRPGRERRRARTSSPATACRCATSRPAPWCTPSSCGPAAARRSPARPARACSCWPRRARSAHLRMPSGEIRLRRRALPGHRRRGRQRRAGQHQARQGGPQPVEGARGRPSAAWR